MLEAKNNSFNSDHNGFISFNNNTSDNNDWFKNLSNIEIPQSVKKVLTLGPKHALSVPKNFITSPKFISSIEAGLIKINDDNLETTTRLRIVNKFINYTTNSVKPANELLSKSDIIETIFFLKKTVIC